MNMNDYGLINNIPCHSKRALLNDLCVTSYFVFSLPFHYVQKEDHQHASMNAKPNFPIGLLTCQMYFLSAHVQGNTVSRAGLHPVRIVPEYGGVGGRR